MNILITAAIALSGIFGASFMAESSVPGDVLYPVKVSINENMKHATAFTAESEAKVSEEIIARRAEEAKELESEGKLDADAKAKLSSSINAEIQNWKKMQEEIKSSGDAEVETNSKASFTNSWNSNKDTLQKLNVSIEGNMNGNMDSNSNSNNSSTNSNMNGSVDVNMNGTLNSNNNGSNSNSQATGTASGILEVR